MWISDARCFDRTLDHQVDQADDRRLRGQIAQVFDIVLGTGGVVGQVLDDGAHRRATGTVVALDQVVDFGAQADAHVHVFAGGQAHRLARVRVLRFGDEQADVVLVLADRHHVVLLQEARRHLHVRRRRVRAFLGREQRQLHHLGQRLGGVALGNQPETRHQRDEIALGVFLMQTLGAAEIGFLEPAARDHLRTDALVEARLCGGRRFGDLGFGFGLGHGELGGGDCVGPS